MSISEESTAVSQPAQPARRSGLDIPAMRFTALASLMVSIVAGVLWGVVRPGYEVTILEGSQIAVPRDAIGANFDALLWFVGISALAGFVLAIAMLRTHRRSLSLEFWLGACALVASLLMTLIGAGIAMLRTSGTFLVAPFNTQPALLVLPFIALLAYWIGLITSSDED